MPGGDSNDSPMPTMVVRQVAVPMTRQRLRNGLLVRRTPVRLFSSPSASFLYDPVSGLEPARRDVHQQRSPDRHQPTYPSPTAPRGVNSRGTKQSQFVPGKYGLSRFWVVANVVNEGRH